MALLEIRDLRVTFRVREGVVHAVNDVQLTLERGQTLGLVGESGSGKTVTSLTVLGLTRSPTTEISGQILLDGVDLVALPEDELRDIRGRRVAMVFQDPLSSLHPMHRIGWQIVEAIQAHEKVGKKAARARAIELLRDVGIPSPEERVDAYPHELSGGMRQRVMIAMALALDPDLLIADEPTSALDVTVQSQILELLAKLQDEKGMALLIVSHDLGVIAEQTDEIAVMYAGRIVEQGTADAVIDRADASVHAGPARLDPSCRRAAHRSSDAHPGLAAERRQPAAWLRVSPEMLACPAVLPGACSGARTGRREPPHCLPGGERGPVTPVASAPLLVVEDLVKHFPARGTQRQRGTVVHAVDGVSFTIAPARDTGPRRRDRLREVDRRPARDAAARADRRTHRARGAGHHALVAAEAAAVAARDADHLPGSVLVAQPAQACRVDRRLRHCAHMASGRAAISGPRYEACCSASGSTPPTTTATRTSSQGDRGSESASLARSSPIRASSSPTSPSRRSTCPSRPRCSTSSPICVRSSTSRCSSSPTTSPWCATSRTGSP